MESNNYRERPQKYRKKKKKRIKRRTILLLVIMLGYLLYHYIYLEIKYQDLLQQKEVLQTEVELSESYQQQLMDRIDESKTDKYMENLARRYFGLVYPDEKVYIEKNVEKTDKKE